MEQALTAGEAHQLNRLAALTSGYACNGCKQHCERAAGGLAISDQLRFLMYHDCYAGKATRARQLFAQLHAEQRTYDEQRLAAAAAVCPQGIDLVSRIRDAHTALA